MLHDKIFVLAQDIEKLSLDQTDISKKYMFSGISHELFEIYKEYLSQTNSKPAKKTT